MVESKLLITTVIEPTISNIIGAYIQYLSFRKHYDSFVYRLYIVDRGEKIAPVFFDFYEETGITAVHVKPQNQNPYLNKFLFLSDKNNLCGFENILLLDWDIIYVGKKNLPLIPHDIVGARKNPPELYSNVIGQGFYSSVLKKHIKSNLPSSINGGVLVGSVKAFESLRKTTINLINNEEIIKSIKIPWLQEQLSLSLAASKVGVYALPDEWNSTPQTKIDINKIQLWHYNDSCEQTRVIKKRLQNSNLIRRVMENQFSTWGALSKKYMSLYEEASEQYPLSMFIKE